MNEHEKRVFVREIITENDYLSLATTDGETPWVAPVEYTVDDELNFYFLSFESSHHVQHIAQNPTVAFAIFDSRQPPMTGEGIQVLGEVTTFSTETNPFVTFGKYPEHPEALAEIDPEYVAYRITPLRFHLPAIAGSVPVAMDDEFVHLETAESESIQRDER